MNAASRPRGAAHEDPTPIKSKARVPRRRRPRAYRETPEYLEGVQRMLRALGRRVGDADIAMLPALAEISRTGEELLGIAARQLHDEFGYSWTDIGTVLGISRQAARQRFSRQPEVVIVPSAEDGAA